LISGIISSSGATYVLLELGEQEEILLKLRRG